MDRMLLEPLLVLEPDDIIVIDMMPEVFVTHVLVGAIGCTANPAQDSAESGVVTLALEHQIVATLVNHVGGNNHPVR